MAFVKKEDQTRIATEQNDGHGGIYHEKQCRELCALHALNNLFQKAKTFTKKQLDEICHNLSPDSYKNPHRSMLGLGNYDINVIMAALQLMGCDTVWFDKRRNLSDLHIDKIVGFILNVPTDLRWGYIRLPIQRKHWVAVRKIDHTFYNLDSKLDTPELIGDRVDLVKYLDEQVKSKDKELILVVSQEYSKEEIWRTCLGGSGGLASLAQSEESVSTADSDAENSSQSKPDSWEQIHIKESGV